MAKRALRRELGLFTATMYGVGIILGAGIYVLIGAGAAEAGNALWIAFLIGGGIAIPSALAYAELASRFPKDAAEYVYLQKAFGKPLLAFIVEWLMLLTLIAGTVAVALGFGGYFSRLTSVPALIGAIGLIVAMSLVNLAGMRESSRFNVVSTLIEASGLVIVCVIGFAYFGAANIFEAPFGFNGILSATSIIFFAFLGFEQLANFSEETRNASSTIPKAIVLSLLISIVLYMLVAIAAVSAIGWEKLASSAAPLAEVAGTVDSRWTVGLSLIALFATANTVLAMLITGSRLLYGLGKQGHMPSITSSISRTGVPHFAVILAMALSLGSLMLGGLKDMALLTDISIFVVFAAINASVIAVGLSSKRKSVFMVPIRIGGIPVPAVLGLLASVYMMTRFPLKIVIPFLGILGLGILAFYLFSRSR